MPPIALISCVCTCYTSQTLRSCHDQCCGPAYWLFVSPSCGWCIPSYWIYVHLTIMRRVVSVGSIATLFTPDSPTALTPEMCTLVFTSPALMQHRASSAIWQQRASPRCARFATLHTRQIFNSGEMNDESLPGGSPQSMSEFFGFVKFTECGNHWWRGRCEVQRVRTSLWWGGQIDVQRV